MVWRTRSNEQDAGNKHREAAGPSSYSFEPEDGDSAFFKIVSETLTVYRKSYLTRKDVACNETGYLT
jgi:hypothetical protein